MIVILSGVLSIFVALLASKLGGVLEAAMMIIGVLGGPMMGLFMFAMTCSYGTRIAAWASYISGHVVALVLMFGAMSDKSGVCETNALPRWTHGCGQNATESYLGFWERPDSNIEFVF